MAKILLYISFLEKIKIKIKMWISRNLFMCKNLKWPLKCNKSNSKHWNNVNHNIILLISRNQQSYDVLSLLGEKFRILESLLCVGVTRLSYPFQVGWLLLLPRSVVSILHSCLGEVCILFNWFIWTSES